MPRRHLLIAFSALAASSASAQHTYYPDYNYPYGNYYKVYLSAASHSPDNQTCLSLQGYPSSTENDLAWANAWSAADGFSTNDDVYPSTYDLTERGYTVQVGYATNQEKVNQANAFGAHVFVSVHSNGGAASGCSRSASNAGTWGMYRTNDTNSYGLALAFRDYLWSVSPGTADKACQISSCSQYTTLYEMEYSNAHTRAYLEQEFHDFEAGAKWMYHDISWQHRIAAAIDYRLGSPR